MCMRKMLLLIEKNWPDWTGSSGDVVSHAKRRVLIFGDRFPFRYFADEYGLDYYAAFPGCAGDTEPSAAHDGVPDPEKAQEEQVPSVLKWN